MPRLSSIATSLVLLVSGATAGAGSPWTQKKGSGFVQLAVYTIGPYDNLYQSSGDDFRTGREITDDTLEVYAEYGLTERWTIVGSAPLKLLETGDPVANPSLDPPTIEAGTRSTLGNVRVAGRRKLVDGSFVLSGQLDLELPTGSFDEATGISSGHDAFTLTPSIAAGKGVSRAYVFGYLGFGLRSGDFSSDWRLGAEGGFRVLGRVWLVGMLDSVRSFENGDVQLARANLETGLYVNDQEYLAYGFKLLVDASKRLGFQATTYSASSGNNVARSPLSGLGVYFKW